MKLSNLLPISSPSPPPSLYNTGLSPLQSPARHSLHSLTCSRWKAGWVALLLLEAAQELILFYLHWNLCLLWYFYLWMLILLNMSWKGLKNLKSIEKNLSSYDARLSSKFQTFYLEYGKKFNTESGL